ncbi:hypothetical protein FYJ43_07420 [Cutibacterium sp. WCA-380-WT-3A]|uniref:Uncharacterized protein n=1 Tax=Cutibacterium porci TaxID=2605781 RepID=A0A7K0J7Z5_9ACTN|nr:hypothetical protein [Cutibacterium porci]MSS45868.1 hypothetical protein [Cutibacterium porci]
MVAIDLESSKTSTAWVDARFFSLHVRSLVHECRVPWRVIALLAHVPSRVVQRLAGQGDRPIHRIRVIDAVRILRISADDIDAARERVVPAGSTRTRLLALQKAGCDINELAVMLGVTITHTADLLSGKEELCTEMTRLRGRAACQARGLLATAESMTTL